MRQRKVGAEGGKDGGTEGSSSKENKARTKKENKTSSAKSKPSPLAARRRRAGSKRRKLVACLKGLVTVFMRAVVGALIFVALCAVYNTLIMRSENAEFAPPGTLVDVGGYKLHLHCYGSNSNTSPDAATSPDQEPRYYPTVVFDHAMMTLRKQFHKVLADNRLPSKTRICVYDRAGYGNSDYSPKTRSAKVEAKELYTLLHNAGEQPPFIFVGASSGGLNVLEYAHMYQSPATELNNNKATGTEDTTTSQSEKEKEVAGVILLDTSPPDVQLPEELKRLEGTVSFFMRLTPTLARLGLIRMVNAIVAWLAPPSYLYDANDLRYVNWVQCHPSYWHAVFGEFLEGEKSLSTLMEERNAPGIPKWEFPLAVLSAGIFPQPMGGMQEAWFAGQRKFASLSNDGTLIIAEFSDHNIPIHQPDLIVQTILEMLDKTAIQ